MIFADASILVAILKGEPDAAELASRLGEHLDEIWVSSLVRFEAAASLAVTRAKGMGRDHAGSEDFQVAASLLDELLREVGAQDLALSPAIGTAALGAAATYGKLAGHPARLNMGDCFAYACAKSLGMALLYKGNDFAQTDLA